MIFISIFTNFPDNMYIYIFYMRTVSTTHQTARTVVFSSFPRHSYRVLSQSNRAYVAQSQNTCYFSPNSLLPASQHGDGHVIVFILLGIYNIYEQSHEQSWFYNVVILRTID